MNADELRKFCSELAEKLIAADKAYRNDGSGAQNFRLIAGCDTGDDFWIYFGEDLMKPEQRMDRVALATTLDHLVKAHEFAPAPQPQLMFTLGSIEAGDDEQAEPIH
jgi:hypothetical protein